ncbi:MAG: DUF1573 domain-containing protein [Saprospiraceae bacterium]
MLKSIQMLAFAAIVALMAVSCQSGNTDVREAARQNVENQSVQPVTAPQMPAVQAPVAPAAPTGPTTNMSFKETTFDFGTVTEGEMVSHTYSFTNTGKEPLVLSDAKGSCGCTVPKWPKEPIAPGQTGQIVVEFNSKAKVGKRDQKVTITANTNPPQTFIHLTGEVLAAGGATPPVVTQ